MWPPVKKICIWQHMDNGERQRELWAAGRADREIADG